MFFRRKQPTKAQASIKSSKYGLVVYLDDAVDIVAAIEALRFNQAPMITLVLPIESPVFEKHFNLKLLKQVSLVLNKEVLLVTSNQFTIDLAQKLDLKTIVELETVVTEVEVEASKSADKKSATDNLASPIDKSDSSQPASTKISADAKTETPTGHRAKIQDKSKSRTKSPKEDKPQVDKTPTQSQSKSQKKGESADADKPALKTKSQIETKPQLATDAKPATVELKASDQMVTRSATLKSMRSLLLFFLATILLIIALITIYSFWPKTAIITIQTDISNIELSIQMDLDFNQATVNSQQKVLPLRFISIDRTNSQLILATGQAEGSQATGLIEVYNCSLIEELVLNSQTIFRKDNLDFVLETDDLEIRIPINDSGQGCTAGTRNKRSLRIKAADAGEAYNLAAGSYQIVGLDEAGYSILGRQIEGGQDKLACVTQPDLELAQEMFVQKREDNTARQQLMQTIRSEHNLIPLEATFQVAVDDVIEPPLCPEVAENQIRQILVYYMAGIKESDLAQLIAADLQKQARGLTILDNGLVTAEYEVYARLSDASEQYAASVQNPADRNYYLILTISQAKAGIILSEDEIIETIAGERVKTVSSRLREFAGIQRVEVQLDPSWAFWLDRLPQNKDDITLRIDNPEQFQHNILN